MRRKIAILLHGPVDNDNRVLKTCKTLSASFDVHLFFVGLSTVHVIPNVTFIPVQYPNSFLQKVKRHTFFCWEYSFFKDAIEDLGESYDIIWANDLPTLRLAAKLAKKLQAKLIYDAHEIYVETLNQFFPAISKFPKNVLINLLLGIMKIHGRSVEKKISKQVHLFITVNDSLGDYFRSNYDLVQPLTIMNFPNKMGKSPVPIDYRTLYSWTEEDIIFIYQGVLNQGRGLPLLIEAIKLSPVNFKLIILGSGPLAIELQSLIFRNQLSEKVRMIAQVPLEHYASYTKGADFGVNLLEDLNLSKKLASPNKLFEYIQAEIPIVCSNTIENSKIIQTFPVGILTQNTPEQICATMIEIAKQFRLKSKENQTIFAAAADQFNWEQQEPKLLKALKELFNDLR